jgi:hypothetical protein
MSRRAVEIEVILLDVLSVIALAVGQTEDPFLDDRVRAVPEGEREAKNLPVVRDAGQAVLAPSVGAGARLVMAEVVPGVAGVAVVFPDGAPLALREVRAPLLPGGGGLLGLLETAFLFRHDSPPASGSGCHETRELEVGLSSHTARPASMLCTSRTVHN